MKLLVNTRSIHYDLVLSNNAHLWKNRFPITMIAFSVPNDGRLWENTLPLTAGVCFTVDFVSLKLCQLVDADRIALSSRLCVAAFSYHGIDSLGWMERIPEDVLISILTWLLQWKAG